MPEHWLLRPRIAVESVAKPSHGDSPGGSHSAVTVVDPPTSIVVTEAVSQPRDDGVGVGVAVGLGVFVAVGLGVSVGRGVSVAVGLGVSVGVAVAGLGVFVAVGLGVGVCVAVGRAVGVGVAVGSGHSHVNVDGSKLQSGSG